jgi:ribose 5-phosphate isomerase B
MKIAIAADHAGFEYKEELKSYLEEKGYEVTDYGTNSPESTDYPDYAHPLATAVADRTYPFGISVCGSGQGMCITTNKHAGVRAALVWNEEITALARQHNNANIVCVPARFIDLDYAKKLIDIFLETEFEGGRHERRVGKI